MLATTYEPYTGKVPANEQARLKMLEETKLLYSEESHLFNRIVKETQAYMGTATALISLIAEDRQWFKARAGLSATETSRNVSFCTQAILTPRIMVVPDTLEDGRFSHNEFVQNAPFVRFYAGAPIIIKKQFAIGTLCVIDAKPRKEFLQRERHYMEDMARIIAVMVEHQMLTSRAS